MAQSLIQTSFFGGELSPNLYGAVDLAQYKKSLALARNFFIDYRGGASTRFGTRYDLQAFNSNFPVRLIPFTASFTITYVMEFGQNYIRFHTNGGPVLEANQAISGVNTSTHVITSAGTYNIGDWLYVLAVGGVTGINGNYYIITGVSGGNYTVTDLFGNAPVWGGAYTSGGTTARVYTIQSPFAGADLALVKFAQNVQFMIFTHPNYSAQLLTYNGPTSWVLTTIAYGTSVPTPTGTSVTQNGGSSTNWDTSYVVTAVDVNGQESAASALIGLSAKDGISVTANNFTNIVSWSAVSGALFYNVYRAPIATHGATVPAGAVYGLVGSTNGTSFIETNPSAFVVPNYSISPPVGQNPFLGGPVASATVTAAGTYTTIPTIVFSAPGGGGATATGTVSLGLTAAAILSAGSGYVIGDLVYFKFGVTLVVKTVGGGGTITAYQPLTYPGTSIGSITTGTAPATLTTIGTNNAGAGGTITSTFGVGAIQINYGGSGYTSAPSITFSAGAATATAILGTQGGNPSVPCYFQQRLALAAPPTAQQTVYFSVPGSPYNFNTHQILQADDAITAPLVSKQLNAVKSMVPMPAGLIVLTATSAWLMNGGSPGSAITAINPVAQSQAYNGANDVPPLVANDDILYVQAKGAIVRDLRFNFGTQVYTGIDISIMAEHLFFGYQIKEWTWAEEPFKLVWAVRNDGALLSLTFSKEQEVYGWTHHDTLGLFQSVASVTESTPSGNVDATYVVVQRTIAGQSLQYVERLADRFMPYGIEDTWALDCAIQSSGTAPAATLTPAAASGVGVAFVASVSVFSAPQVGDVIRVGGGIATITAFVSGTQVTCTITQPITAVYTNGLPIPQASGSWTLWTPATIFTGLAQLNGSTVTALADGVVVSGLTVSNGSITLPNPATKVLVGLSYLPQLQTLPLDAGQPTIQGKRKRSGPTVFKVTQTRGLSTGRTFSTLVAVKDAGPPMLSAFPNLVFGDEWVVLDALYDTYGQVCFQQNNPWPATIMAHIPDVAVGDTAR